MSTATAPYPLIPHPLTAPRKSNFRSLFLHALPTIVSMLTVGCTGVYPETSADTQAAKDLAGRWAGSSTIVVNWTQARTLSVQLDIHPDGTVTGQVGDATLKDGILQASRGDLMRSFNMGRDYQITAKLDGAILAAEQVQRDGVTIVFDQEPDQTLHGGLTTTGWDFGGKDYMKLSASNMILSRQP